jgi:hypothetical protein
MPAGSSVNLSGDARPWVIAADAREGFGARAREVWQYRRTLSFFAINSVQALYAKTRLGLPWLFIRPIFPLLIGVFVFGSVMKVPSGAVPYFIFFVSWRGTSSTGLCCAGAAASTPTGTSSPSCTFPA